MKKERGRVMCEQEREELTAEKDEERKRENIP